MIGQYTDNYSKAQLILDSLKATIQRPSDNNKMLFIQEYVINDTEVRKTLEAQLAVLFTAPESPEAPAETQS
jgi:ribose 5-phosphate isomerase RpiB